MPIEFRCTQCGKLLRTGDDTGGMQARCPECEAVTPIPTGGPASPVPGMEPHAASMTSSPFPPPPPPPGQEGENPYQSPSAYPTTPVGPPTPGSFQPTAIDFGDIFSRTWTIFADQWGMCLAVVILVYLFNLVVGNALSYGGWFLGLAAGDPALASLLFALGSAAGWLLNIWIGIGQALIFLNIARGDPAELGQLLTGGRYLLRILGASIIVGIGVGFGFLLLIVPGIFLALVFWPFYWLIVDRDVGVFDSLQLAQEITKGNKATVFVLAFVSLALIFVSALPCGLGLLFTIPFFGLMWPVTYLAMSGQATYDQRVRQTREWFHEGGPTRTSESTDESAQQPRQ